MEQNELKKIIEAALFMSPKTVSIDDLAKLSNTTIAQTRVALNELMDEYEQRNSALQIRADDTGIKMDVISNLKEVTSQFAAAPEFNKGVMKTLAYISYKQPIRQTQVIRFRNNKGYDHIKILEENGFIRREQVGKSYIIYTTKKFLEYFGNQKQKNIEENKKEE